MVKNSVSCECTMRSKIFEIIGNRETGLKLVALVGSPLLYTGVIFASFMDNGNLPSESDLLKMRVTDGAKRSEHAASTRAGTPSLPVDFVVSTLLSNLRTHAMDTGLKQQRSVLACGPEGKDSTFGRVASVTMSANTCPISSGGH